MQENVNDASINLNKNINVPESTEFSLFKQKILEVIDTIRTKKKRADINSIYKQLCRNQASNIDEKAIARFVSELTKLNEIVNKKTNYDDSFSKVICKADKQVTTLLANMTSEIDSTLPIDCSICTPANEFSKSNDNTNQNDLETEDENISEVTPFINNTDCTPMISNEKNVSRKKDKQIERVEAELGAIKSHLKCEIGNMISKIESISNSFVTSLHNFNDQLKNFNILKDNLTFLQKELEEKNQIIKTLMETQPIHESHSLKQQQQQNQIEERFSEEESLPWQKVTSKQRNNRNQSLEKLKLFVGNLNQSITKKDLNELLGLECTPYLRETCSIKMPKIKHMGQSKGFTFLNVPADVRNEIIKLDGIECKNQTIKIEKARTQYVSKPHKAKIRSSPVVDKNPENQDMFIRNIVPGSKSYAEAKVPSNSAVTSNNVVIFEDSIFNFSTKLKCNISRALTNGRARFKYFPAATSKELLHYIDVTLEESNFEVAVIHVGVNDLMNSNNSVDKLLKNIYSMAEKYKKNGVKKIFIRGIVKNNQINDFITQEVNRRIYDDCQKETTVLLSMMVSVVTFSSKMVFIYWIVVNKV